MSFSDHKITQFTHRISELADQPNMPADELKARFDSSPEELRTAHNAVCDDAARLEARVDGIIAETFGDTIDREMLSDELAAELDGKATQSALASETAARESADDALQTAVSQKCEIYIGSYTGNFSGYNEIPQGAETPMSHITSWQTITLGFRPRAVLIFGYEGTAVSIDRINHNMRGGIILDGIPYGYYGTIGGEITENGFRVCCTRYGNFENYAMLNAENETYRYMAIK